MFTFNKMYWHQIAVQNCSNRFLAKDHLKTSANIRKRDSIDAIKFVGRQHALLTEVADQINFSYTLQV